MIYRTCIGCVVDPKTCARRQEVARGMSGLGITSAKFRCDERAPHFSVGQRVLVSLATWEYDELVEFEVRATVLKEAKPGRFLLKVDEGKTACEEFDVEGVINNRETLVITATHSRLRLDPDDKRILRVCPTCVSVAGRDCYRSGAFYAPEGCLYPAAERATP